MYYFISLAGTRWEKSLKHLKSIPDRISRKFDHWLYNVDVINIKTIKLVLSNQWFGAPISQFFVKLDQKWVDF